MQLPSHAAQLRLQAAAGWTGTLLSQGMHAGALLRPARPPCCQPIKRLFQNMRSAQQCLCHVCLAPTSGHASRPSFVCPAVKAGNQVSIIRSSCLCSTFFSQCLRCPPPAGTLLKPACPPCCQPAYQRKQQQRSAWQHWRVASPAWRQQQRQHRPHWQKPQIEVRVTGLGKLV